MVNYNVVIIGGATVTYQYTGATTGSGSGTGSPGTFNNGVTNVTISASHVSFPPETCSFTVTVTDNQAPAGSPPAGLSNVNACLAQATASAPFDPVYAASGYTDNCTSSVTVTLMQTSVNGNNCFWTINYTFMVQDEAGNTLNNQVLQHSGGDDSPPVFIDCPLMSPFLIPMTSLHR